MKIVENYNNTWRKVASVVYKKPIDSKILGSVEIDVTDTESFITQCRRDGLKITLTHIVVLIISRALKEEVPEFNAYVKRGRIIPRKQIDASVSVLIKDSEMSSIKISNADTMTLSELVEEMSGNIKSSRKGKENETMKSKKFIAALPWPFRGMFFTLYRKVTIDWGITIPFFGVNSDSFGSFLISNIGTFGLDVGYPALFPNANLSLVVIVGGLHDKPWVVDNKIIPRRILTISVAIDHRIADAQHGGMLFRYLKRKIVNPAELLDKPSWVKT